MSSRLDESITGVKGVGEKKAALFLKLGIKTVRDLIYHLPRSYIDCTSPVPVMMTELGGVNVVEVEIVRKQAPARIRKGMTVFRLLATDGTDDLTVTIYNLQYLFDSLKIGEKYLLCGKVTGNLTRREMSSPTVIKSTSADKIIPVYPLTAGLNRNAVTVAVKNALSLVRPDDLEFLPADIIKKAGLMPEYDALRAIHFPRTRGEAEPARKRLAFDELLTLRLGMTEMRERVRRSTTFAMKPVDISGYTSALPFRLTGAQLRAISECMRDMACPTPMNRLLLGDVGSGKTAVAAACCYFAAKNGAQSVMMAPTEILASQHYDSLRGFLEPSGVRVGLLTGSLTKKQKTAVVDAAKNGELDVIVGTHALFQTGVEYSRLGLVITDEQHRFGVAQRSALAQKGENPHRLVMSATPIPRTLALMIYGELDISVLDELPAGRKEIKTYAVTGKSLRSRAMAFVRKELDAGGQAYIVCPAVEAGDGAMKNVVDYARELSEGEFSGYRVGVLHGQLPAAKKDEVMRDFKDGKYDLLVCTTVVEVGVDVPNASVMTVENADRFGLSQLHQLRGRVGRGERASSCILITDNPSEDVRKRLKILCSTNNGFEISEADLEIRGPGDFFGSAQHGLPPLKIADLASDSELVALAQSTADSLTDTGRISLPGCEPLRERVKRLFERVEE